MQRREQIIGQCGKVLLSLLLVQQFVTGCSDSSIKRAPNVLLLVTDDQRPDTVRALGNTDIETPNLDLLVRDGAVFDNAASPNPICEASRAEILTGCSGFKNGVFDFGSQLDPSLVLWGDAMRGAGYSSWFVGKWHNDGQPTTRGYDESDGLMAHGGQRWWTPQKDGKGREITGFRGWVFQNDDGDMFPERGVGLTADISSEFADAAIRFIQREADKPFFLHVNFTAPHDPLIMPPGYEGKYDPEKIPLPKNFLAQHPFDHGNSHGRDERLLPWPRTAQDVRDELVVYYAVISHMDQQIGRIFDALKKAGEWDNTIVVFTSDQGVAIGSHGLRGKQNMYEHTVGVPLILRGPGVPAGQRFAAQVYLRDLYPTVLDLCGIPVPETVEATSFAAVLARKLDSIHNEVFGYFRGVQRMVRTDRFKLIDYPQVGEIQLFDLAADPEEVFDLSGDASHAILIEELRQKLRTWQSQVGDPLLGNP